MRDIEEIYNFISGELDEDEYELLIENIKSEYIRTHKEEIEELERLKAMNPEPPDGTEPQNIIIASEPATETEIASVTETPQENITISETVVEDTADGEIKVKENFFIRTARKSYDRKIKKANLNIAALDKEILKIKNERKQKTDQSNKLKEQLLELRGDMVGLMNANAFLEEHIEKPIIGRFILFVKNANEKRLKQLKTQTDNIIKRINNVETYIKTLDDDILKLDGTVRKQKQNAVDNLQMKKDNLIRAGVFANPLTAMLINIKDPAAVADIEKYCYRKITEEELEKIKKFEKCSVKKNKQGECIVRFLRCDKDIIDNALIA